jgi:hypothetical protein
VIHSSQIKGEKCVVSVRKERIVLCVILKGENCEVSPRRVFGFYNILMSMIIISLSL